MPAPSPDTPNPGDANAPFGGASFGSPGPDRPVIAVSMGDPSGIGPEVLVKALADRALRRSARFRVYGLHTAMAAAADRAGIEPYWWRVRHDGGVDLSDLRHDVLLVDHASGEGSGSDFAAARPAPGAAPAPGPTKGGGIASFRFVEEAIAAAGGVAGKARGSPPHPGEGAHAVVTGPISKEAWALAGRSRYPGHTELLASRFHSKRTRMMFVSPRLNIILVTAHLPLMDLRNVVTIGRIHETIDLGAAACRELGVHRPRIAVCGLNPHAGEAGLLGDEEQRLIGPAIRLAQEQGVDASGPFPGDTIFRDAVDFRRFDLVVAMYHDQGLIPVKLLAFDRAVNTTVGLPIVRTSPDHGTAYDIAGRDRADPGSMHAALELAVKMAGSRLAGAA